MKTNFSKSGILTIKLLMICLAFSIYSCDKDDSEGQTTSNDYYYVEYVITGNGIYGRFSNWSVTTPQGNYSNSGLQVRNWTQTYGPVNDGFNCRVEINDYIGGAPTIEIYVSKNDEPFALKESSNGDFASYTIDF